jgi:hypothetical protein
MSRSATAKAPGPSTFPSCTHRDPDDDFFCLRYQVWYPSRDCAFRSKFKTFPGCLDCEQGRFNLKRHESNLVRGRFQLLDIE